MNPINNLGMRIVGIGLSLATLTSLTGCGAFVTQEGIFPLPTIRIVWPTPAQFGLEFETVNIQTETGATIYGWHIPAEAPRATVLFHHGALINRSAMFDTYLLLHRNNLNVLICDYQGFGESLTPVAQLSTVSSDTDAALSYLQSRDDAGTDRIIIFGSSMGTLPAFAQAARMPEKVEALIVEGSFARTLPPGALILLGLQPDPVAFDRIPDELDALQNAPLVELPTLFLHSRNDLTTPLSGAQQLYGIVTAPKRFYELDGGHIQAVTADPNYEEYLIEFIDDVLGE